MLCNCRRLPLLYLLLEPALFFRHSGRSLVTVVLAVLALVVLAAYVRSKLLGPVVSGYEVTAQALQQQVVASGTVSSQALARIGSEITGVLKARHVREGDVVKPGDLLLELRDDEQQARVREAEAALAELAGSLRPQAEAALREAVNAHERAGSELTRREALYLRQQVSSELIQQARSNEVAARAARERLQVQLAAVSKGGTTEQQLTERLVAAQAALAKTRIVATVNGTVQTRAVEPGDQVQPGRTLLEIFSDNSREILVPVDERSFGGLALGQSAQVVADAYPDRILAATVNFLAPAVDTSRGTVDVHLALDADADFLRQGMTVSATITTASRANALVVGNEVLRKVRGNQADVLQVSDSHVESATVTLGLRGTVASEIVAGLSAGDVVLVADAEIGTRVRVDLQDRLATGGE